MRRVERRTAEIADDIFRAYDIRGIVGETLTEDVFYDLGLALGSELRHMGGKQMVIARDGRLSGPLFSESLCAGLLDTGIDVLDIGAVPTPVLYFAANNTADKSGLMITGSHNPSNYNGLKMVIKGETLSNERIQAIKQRLQDDHLLTGKGEYNIAEVATRYIQTITNQTLLDRPLSVVVDAGNGIAGGIGTDLLEELGCQVEALYCDVDGTFPNHHPDPTDPKNLEDLIAKVIELEADIGIAFDGDGDRLGVVTNTGKIIWPDRQMMLFAREILKKHPKGLILYDVKCSKRLDDVIREAGGEPLMWKTGHSFIKAKLKETNALLGGEMSGHIFFNDNWFGFDDGLYSAARLLSYISRDPQKRTVDEIFADYPDSINTPELKIYLDENKKFSFMQKFIEKASFPQATLNTIDGLRVDFPYGWGLERPSNTTPC